MPDVDFSRERRVLDLAVKLQLGAATSDEVLEAADTLSRAAGERVGLEHKVAALERALAFFMRVLKIFEDLDLRDFLTWSSQNPAPLWFLVNCSDTFDWGTADSEKLTPENLHVLEQSIKDVQSFGYNFSELHWATTLFCARVRGERPMPQVSVPEDLQVFFNEAGPPR
jgi:hypothetical protein